jgi:hypothetical protein
MMEELYLPSTVHSRPVGFVPSGPGKTIGEIFESVPLAYDLRVHCNSSCPAGKETVDRFQPGRTG